MVIGWLLSAALGGDVRFLPEGGTPSNPVWSPDGKWLAYEVVADDYSSVDLYVSAIAKNGVVRDGEAVPLPGAGTSFASSRVAIEATWHPQGMLLFSGSVSGGLFRLYIYSPGGAGPTALFSTTAAPGNLSAPDLSPTGNYITFVSGDREVRTWNRTTNAWRTLASTPEIETAPAWSPDGERIVLQRGHDIVSVDVASGDETVIDATSASDSRPNWAGEAILFFRDSATDWDIVIARPGEAPTVLVEGVSLPSRTAPAVSPDGKWVAWSAGTSQIGLTSLDGEEQLLLETGHAAVADPVLGLQGDALLVAYTWKDGDHRRLRVEPISEVALTNARDFGVTSVGAAVAAGSATEAAADEAAALEEPAETDGDASLDDAPADQAAATRTKGASDAEPQRSTWFGCLGAAGSSKEGSPAALGATAWPFGALLLGLAMGLLLAWALRRQS